MLLRAGVLSIETDFLVKRALDIAGVARWNKRLEEIADQLSALPIYRDYYLSRYAIETGVIKLVVDREDENKKFYWPSDDGTRAALAFLCMSARVYRRLNSTGKTNFRGMFLDSLKDEKSLAALAFEMQVANHFMRRMFHVDFTDLQKRARCDLKVTRNETTIEIECKSLSGDLGRRVHLRKIYNVARLLNEQLTVLSRQMTTGCLFDIVVDERLTASNRQVEAIRQAISSQQSLSAAEAGLSVRCISFDLSDTPFRPGAGHEADLLGDALQGFLIDRFGIHTGGAFCVASRTAGAVVVSFRAKTEDKVIDGVYRRMKKEALDQFSGAYPALICGNLEALTEAQLEAMSARSENGQKPHGLTLISNRLFSESGREHLAGVIWFASAHGAEQRSEALQSGHDSALVYSYMHPKFSDLAAMMSAPIIGLG